MRVLAVRKHVLYLVSFILSATPPRPFRDATTSSASLSVVLHLIIFSAELESLLRMLQPKMFPIAVPLHCGALSMISAAWKNFSLKLRVERAVAESH